LFLLCSYGGFLNTLVRCSVKYARGIELLYFSVFGYRSLTRGFTCID
jgi:hypothetical protein